MTRVAILRDTALQPGPANSLVFHLQRRQLVSK